MSVLDFLFEGSPSASVTTYGSTSSNMPTWLSDYTQGVITRANAAGAEPYQAYGGPRLAEMTPDQLKAFDITRAGVGSHIPGMNNAINTVGGIQNGPLAAAAAQPYMANASKLFPDNVNQYMNPYVQNVLDRSRLEANRALNEDFMPALEAKFGSAGVDPRSSSYLRQAQRGVRDISEGLQSQYQSALAGAYDNAATTFGADMSRQGTLAATAGNLASNDANTKLNAAQTQGTLEQWLKQMNLGDAAAMENIGQTQQADTQRSLDLAYNDFLQQRDQPLNMAERLAALANGVPFNKTSNTTEQVPGETGPSPLAQVGSVATGIGGILQMLKGTGIMGLRHGGRVHRFKRGGRVNAGTLRRY